MMGLEEGGAGGGARVVGAESLGRSRISAMTSVPPGANSSRYSLR